MARVVFGATPRIPRSATEIQSSRLHPYKAGGGVSPEGAVHKHEKHLHEGKPETKFKKRKRGGAAVEGKMPKKRLDKKPRRADGGDVEPPYGKGPEMLERAVAQPQYNVDSEPPMKRAFGGHVKKPRMPKGTTNVIVHAGGGGKDGADPQALQQAKQQGAQMGAMAVMSKLKGAGAGLPPGAPPPGAGAAPPGAAPPGGGMPGGGMAPPFRKKGGRVDDESESMVKVKAHHRRKSGGKVC